MTEQEDSTKIQSVIDIELTGNKMLEEEMIYEARFLDAFASVLDSTSTFFSITSSNLKRQSRALQRGATKKRSLIEIARLRKELTSLSQLSQQLVSQFGGTQEFANSFPRLTLQLFRVKALTKKRTTRQRKR